MNVGRCSIRNCLISTVLQFIDCFSGHSVAVLPRHLKTFSIVGGISRMLAGLNAGLLQTEIQTKAGVRKRNY